MVQMPGPADPSGPQLLPSDQAPSPGASDPPAVVLGAAPPVAPFGPPSYGPRPGSYRSLWIGLAAVAVALVVAIGAIVGVVAAWSNKPAGGQGTATGTTKDPGNLIQISKQDLDSLVAARSTALRSKDLKGFVAQLDPSNTELVAGQTQLFNNLRKVSFRESRYQMMAQWGRAVDRFGRGVTIDIDVAFAHQIDGYDPQPVAEWYRWTVARKDKGSAAMITAVTGAQGDVGGYSKTIFYPGPWDKFGDMKVVGTEHTLLLVDQSLAGQAERYAPVAERAAVDDIAAWQAGGQGGEIFQRFVVSLVPDREQMGTLYEMTAKDITEAGHAMPMPVFGSMKKTSGSTRVVMDLSSSFFQPDEPTGPLEIFRHEFAHSMVEGVNKHDNPDAAIWGQQLWIVEGFAEYIANRGTSGGNTRATASQDIVRSGKFDGRLPVGMHWDFADNKATNFNYWLSHQAIHYMAAQYGETKALGFIATYYQGASVNDTFQKALGVDMATFEQGWAKFVRAKAS
jgi:hypothetical protein